MIPVRRWPLAVALVVALTVAWWMPLLRWCLIGIGLYGLVLAVASGVWWSAFAAPVSAAGVWAARGAERGSRDVRLRLWELRDLLADWRDGAP